MNGSSPRMRGARLATNASGDRDRIIPADAGSTKLCACRAYRIEDHPRGCGEHPTVDRAGISLPGSSPRMRGALPCVPGSRQWIRIIPADAGSTTVPVTYHGLGPDHPRGCGEHRHSRWPRSPGMGSSPRMRGAHILAVCGGFAKRIIPADAGSTCCC